VAFFVTSLVHLSGYECRSSSFLFLIQVIITLEKCV
jgi:hypothetical protein